MIPRWLELSSERSCLVVGPRRAGKTTLLRNLFADLPYLTLDDYDLLRLARSDPKKLVRMVGERGILDEVQRVPELLVAVKYGIDELGQTILMTGSSSLGLTSAGSETLAGRIDLHECSAFCWGEEEGPPSHRSLHMPPDPLAVVEANRRLDSFMVFGGFPEVVLEPDSPGKSRVLRNYRNTYFTRDLLLLANINNADAMLALLAYLSVSTGTPLDVSNAARESGISYPTTRKYLNVLLASRLVFKLYGYQYGPAKRYTRAAKYYFSDMGIYEATTVPLSPGQRLEAFVVSELEKRRKLGALACDNLFYYRSAAGAEIDVIIEEPELLTAVEIKHTRRPVSRDTRRLREFRAQAAEKPRRAVLLYPGEEAGELDGVEILPVGHLWRSL